jgi:hypothetical protein
MSIIFTDGQLSFIGDLPTKTSFIVPCAPSLFSGLWIGLSDFIPTDSEHIFNVGDKIKISEFDGLTYSGRVLYAHVLTKITSLDSEAIKPGFCVLGLNILKTFADA